GEAIRKVLDMNGRAGDEGTVGQLWRLYQESPQWKRLAPSTQRLYGELWASLAKGWEGGVVAAIRPADVARWLRVARADAPVVANREVAVLSNLFNLAVERGEIERNPCREVRRNPEDPRTRLVEKGELEAFAAWALKRGDSATVLVSMAEFAALTGNRRAEFRTLHWPQVDEEIIRLTRAKQRGNREKRELVAVSEALRAVLERVKAMGEHNAMGPVFRAPRTGNPYTEAGFKAMWNRLMAAALTEKVIEQRFTFHDLRAHYTTYFKLKFGALPELHADPATTAGVYERSREVRRKSL
ncbi:MAG TPA: site-specific integrase, partial [Ramlibacter sp.]|nr:site-specific integrase [Ramlibacter sp.]